MDRVTVQGVELTLMPPIEHHDEWIDYGDYTRLLEAAWLRLSTVEPPLNPRLIGEPGLGKTTLGCAVARKLNRGIFIFQCTMDTRPEDLLVTPVLAADRRIEYRASSVVSAMLRGGVLILDEGNRMPERSWASLAPLLDGRRYIESTVASIRVSAHPDFRLCVTMNDDSSVYELPGYIQSRLKPKIELGRPPWEIQERIIRTKCPGVDDGLLRLILETLKERAQERSRDSIRDVLALAQYAQKLKTTGAEEPLRTAVEHVLEKPAAPLA